MMIVDPTAAIVRRSIYSKPGANRAAMVLKHPEENSGVLARIANLLDGWEPGAAQMTAVYLAHKFVGWTPSRCSRAFSIDKRTVATWSFLIEEGAERSAAFAQTLGRLRFQLEGFQGDTK